MTVCQAARAIEKHFAGECETPARAHRSEPLSVLMGPEIAVPRCAIVLSDSHQDSGARHPRAGEGGLSSDDESSHLPVVTTLSAAKDPGWIRLERGRRQINKLSSRRQGRKACVRAPPAVTEVATDIRALPTVGGSGWRRSWRVRHGHGRRRSNIGAGYQIARLILTCLCICRERN